MHVSIMLWPCMCNASAAVLMFLCLEVWKALISLYAVVVILHIDWCIKKP